MRSPQASAIHRGVPVVGDYGRAEESRKLEPTVPVWGDQHGGLDALGLQSGDAPGPVAFDRGSAFDQVARNGRPRSDYGCRTARASPWNRLLVDSFPTRPVTTR